MQILMGLNTLSARFLGLVGLLAAALAIEMEIRTVFFLDPTATYMVASYVLAMSLLFLSPKLHRWTLQLTRRFGPRILLAKGCGIWFGLVALFLFAARDEVISPAHPEFPAPYGALLTDTVVAQLLIWSLIVLVVMVFPFGLSYRLAREEREEEEMPDPTGVSLLNLLSWVPLAVATAIAAWGQWGIEVAPTAPYQTWVQGRLLLLLPAIFVALFLWPLWANRRPRPPLHMLARGVLWVVLFLFVAGNLLYGVFPWVWDVLQR